jgi:hypothetical protein
VNNKRDLLEKHGKYDKNTEEALSNKEKANIFCIFS